MDYQALGLRIRTRRCAKQMTQEQLAKQIGISTSFLGHIERGSRVLSVETLMSVCNALEMTPNDLLCTEGKALAHALPERIGISVPSFLQGVADLLKNQQISE